MPTFGTRSAYNLSTCSLPLQELFNEVVKHYDCSVLCGHRNSVLQEKAFLEGKSTKQWPDSKHNGHPSVAVDVVPYPIDWEDMERFRHFVGFVEGIAVAKGIKIRNGGDWDSDREFDDQRFIDMPHFELCG